MPKKLRIQKFVTPAGLCTPVSVEVEAKAIPTVIPKDPNTFADYDDLTVDVTLRIGTNVGQAHAYGIDELRAMRVGLVKLIRELERVVAWSDQTLAVMKDSSKEVEAHNEAWREARRNRD